MEVTRLRLSLAKQVAVCRGRAGEAGAEGASPAQGPAVQGPAVLPWTTMEETPEARATGIKKASPHTDL